MGAQVLYGLMVIHGGEEENDPGLRQWEWGWRPGPGPAARPRAGSGFPKSAFGHLWPPRAHRGRLGIRVARSIELSQRSGC